MEEGGGGISRTFKPELTLTNEVPAQNGPCQTNAWLTPRSYMRNLTVYDSQKTNFSLLPQHTSTLSLLDKKQKEKPFL